MKKRALWRIGAFSGIAIACAAIVINPPHPVAALFTDNLASDTAIQSGHIRLSGGESWSTDAVASSDPLGAAVPTCLSEGQILPDPACTFRAISTPVTFSTAGDSLRTAVSLQTSASTQLNGGQVSLQVLDGSTWSPAPSEVTGTKVMTMRVVYLRPMQEADADTPVALAAPTGVSINARQVI